MRQTCLYVRFTCVYLDPRKAFHNNVPGAYGVNEDVKVFSFGDDISSRAQVVADMKAFIAEKAKDAYRAPEIHGDEL